MVQFDFGKLKFEDRQMFLNFVGELREPDLIIAPDGNPYLWRWHVTPAKGPANIYLHIQTNDDPERPLHDHPWDNTSVILAGGYKEMLSLTEGEPSPETTSTFLRQKGDMIHRKAAWAHRLKLLVGEDYAMTLFVTGPKCRDWGFWYPDGWRLWSDVTRQIGAKSVQFKPEAM
jgi:hypothetical protein